MLSVPGWNQASAKASAVRHRPEDTVRYGVLERNHGVFFAHLQEQGRRVPAFVRAEFEAYLRCGGLEHGFVRVKCEGCRHEHLVAFSCKGRGFCSSCVSRRMAETGVVTFIPRFASKLNVNTPLHMLVPDGGWRFVNGKAHFERPPGAE